MKRMFLIWLAVAVLLAACGGSQANGLLPAGATKIALDAFPAGIGRGYPAGVITETDASPAFLERGQTPPNFVLLLPDGRYVALADLAGRPVIINFWASWCGPCRAEMPELLAAAHANPDLALLAVNVQEAPETLAAFAEEFQMDVPTVVDEEGKLSELYGVRGLPTSVFVGPDGKITRVFPGPLTTAMIAQILGDN